MGNEITHDSDIMKCVIELSVSVLGSIKNENNKEYHL